LGIIEGLAVETIRWHGGRALNPFFQVVQQLVAVRDDEEGYSPSQALTPILHPWGNGRHLGPSAV